MGGGLGLLPCSIDLLKEISKEEDIKITFGTSKNYFKMALGGLMKKGLIAQDAEGCRLL